MVLNRIVELGAQWNIDRKRESGNIGWEIIGLIEVKDVERLNKGSGSGDISETD